MNSRFLNSFFRLHFRILPSSYKRILHSIPFHHLWHQTRFSSSLLTTDCFIHNDILLPSYNPQHPKFLRILRRRPYTHSSHLHPQPQKIPHPPSNFTYPFPTSPPLFTLVRKSGLANKNVIQYTTVYANDTSSSFLHSFSSFRRRENGMSVCIEVKLYWKIDPCQGRE